MPIYAYTCSSCGHKFDCTLPLKKRKKPTKDPCPSCGMKKVKQDFATISVLNADRSDKNLAVKGPFKEVLQKIKGEHPRGHIGNTKMTQGL